MVCRQNQGSQHDNASVDAMRKDGHPLTPGTALVIGKEVYEMTMVIHLNIITQHMLLHIICGINLGWDFTISRDGIYCLCKNIFGMGYFLHCWPSWRDAIVPKEMHPKALMPFDVKAQRLVLTFTWLCRKLPSLKIRICQFIRRPDLHTKKK